ncbi:hypothetical protein V6Z11_A01G133400 [Gossypium hirsutum]
MKADLCFCSCRVSYIPYRLGLASQHYSLERHVQLILHLHRKVDTRLQISTFGILENLE